LHQSRFLQGTGIGTPIGPCAVAALRIGDRVLTRGGEAARFLEARLQIEAA
jgi:hypothetical protein